MNTTVSSSARYSPSCATLKHFTVGESRTNEHHGSASAFSLAVAVAAVGVSHFRHGRVSLESARLEQLDVLERPAAQCIFSYRLQKDSSWNGSFHVLGVFLLE